MSLMTHEYVQGRSVDFAILLAFLSGCMQLLMAFLRLGKLYILFLDYDFV